MKRTILSLLTSGAIITTSYSAYAQLTDSNEVTITQNLKELKNNIKETAQIGAEKFNEKLKNVYDSLSTKIDDIETAFKDKKDSTAVALSKKRDDIKQAMVDYREATNEKANEMRIKLVEKLENLNKEVENYNKKHNK